MQEEVTRGAVTLIVDGAKLSEQVFEKAVKKFLEEIQKSQKPKIYRGRQSLKQLARQNAGLANIEISDRNINAGCMSWTRTATVSGTQTESLCSTPFPLPTGAVPKRWNTGGRHGRSYATPSLRKRGLTFLTKHLISIGVDPETAEADACRIEHDISAETYERLKELVTKE